MTHAQHANPNSSHSSAGDTVLREQLAKSIRSGESHLDAAAVFSSLRDSHWGAQISGAPHTLWQLLEHMRFTLHDLYTFSTDAAYKAPRFPQDYWSDEIAPADATHAKQAVRSLQEAQDALARLVEKSETDLFARIPWGDGQTILREALLAATHTSYHLGQAMFLRKQLEG